MLGLASSRRIIVVDDQPDIHADFRKILVEPAPGPSDALSRLRAAVHGAAAPTPPRHPRETYAIESAFQGEDAYRKILLAREAGEPFSLAFIDMRMPPGWDGLRTLKEVCAAEPEIQIVICTAYSDQPWSAIDEVADRSDRVLVLKKPFDTVEIQRITATLTAKWRLAREAAARRDELEQQVAQARHFADTERSDLLARIRELEELVEELRGQAEDIAGVAFPQNAPAPLDPPIPAPETRYHLELPHTD